MRSVATAHLAEGSRNAIAGTDLGRLCDDGAGGLCGAGRAGVSPPPLSLARPEIDVIGVSNYNQHTFDLVVSKNHTITPVS